MPCGDFVKSAGQIYEMVNSLLEKTEAGKTPIRLAGISLTDFRKKTNLLEQMYFPFYDPESS